MSLRILIATLLLTLAGTSLAMPTVGQAAPDFTATDSKGAAHSLSDYRGKIVVLEWTNHDCPYVRKHYGSGNMQALQQHATAQGVVWLSVISSAPGKQGYVDGKEADALTAQRGASPTAVLLDPEGEIGRLYGARTTPHMFIVDGEGTLRYMGGIDSIASSDTADIATATPYVKVALSELAAGKAVSDAVTRPYGCSIKY